MFQKNHCSRNPVIQTLFPILTTIGHASSLISAQEVPSQNLYLTQQFANDCEDADIFKSWFLFSFILEKYILHAIYVD